MYAFYIVGCVCSLCVIYEISYLLVDFHSPLKWMETPDNLKRKLTGHNTNIKHPHVLFLKRILK